MRRPVTQVAEEARLYVENLDKSMLAEMLRVLGRRGPKTPQKDLTE